ncbi:MAG: pyridoxal-phosphate dependent enzyme, partial [Synergistaceae bacterium]|nr:pyridoxal-phosphate dependent enzyme [Synergistaceae bacterium]
TITGVGAYLKSVSADVRIVAVEPEKSPVLSGGAPSPHQIQGIGAGFIPPVLDTEIYDEIIKVSDQDAAETARALAKEEGILLGFSSGAAVYAARLLAERLEEHQKIAVIAPDNGERYLSTTLFE